MALPQCDVALQRGFSERQVGFGLGQRGFQFDAVDAKEHRADGDVLSLFESDLLDDAVQLAADVDELVGGERPDHCHPFLHRLLHGPEADDVDCHTTRSATATAALAAPRTGGEGQADADEQDERALLGSH